MQKINKILSLVADLTEEELLTLNKAIITILKAKGDLEIKKASITFKVGDFVVFQGRNGKIIQGVITRKNPKTFRVDISENQYTNVSPTYLTKLDKPNETLRKLKKQINAPSEEAVAMLKQILEDKDGTFH